MNKQSDNTFIRQFEERDTESVIALWRLVFPDLPRHNVPEDDIDRKLAVQRELFFVAESDSKIVGSAMAGFDGHRGWVYYVAVHPDYRRQGIGTALMETVEESLKAIGCPKLNLQIREGNEEVEAFYKRLGYHVEQRVSMGKIFE
jgi:ribosomal protein S18 acetylase RimI-like enzyme